MNNSVALPPDSDKGFEFPENSILFEYNPKATEDAALIDSIVKNTTKIKPLASADLDSFLMLGRQFMNIGKPFQLEGIGTLEKTQSGALDFRPGQHIIQKIEAPKALKEDENEESSGLFNTYNDKPDNNSKTTVIVIVTAILLGLITWAVYHFAFPKKTIENSSVANKEETLPAETVTKKDTPSTLTNINNDSSKIISSPNDEYTFRVVFTKTTNKETAKNTMDKLNGWGHKVIMYTNDSTNYKLAELFKLPVGDTARIKDSMYKIYDRKNVFVEIK